MPSGFGSAGLLARYEAAAASRYATMMPATLLQSVARRLLDLGDAASVGSYAIESTQVVNRKY